MNSTPRTQSNETKWREAAERMIDRVRDTTNSRLDGFPHYADPATGEWTTTPNGFWTGGFFVGELWLSGVLTGDPAFHAAAREWLAKLESRVESGTVFRGFLFYYSAVTGAVLAEDRVARSMAQRSSRSLAETFRPMPGILPLGRDAEEAHTVGDNEANIDGISAVPLMLWSARTLGDSELARIAVAHAKCSARLFVNSDGSVIQSASFDPETGATTRRYTHKGYSDESIWTRAQAWAMLGYAGAARLAPEEPELLAVAETVSDWWLAHVPEDRVSYWDFSAPITPQTRRDTSGTAIAAAALLKLSAIHPDRAKAEGYRKAAKATVDALVTRHLTPVGEKDTRPPGILADGCFDPRSGTAVSNELIWGDYFLLESLAALSGRLPADL